METSWKRLLALEVSAFGFFGLFGGCYAVLLADLSGALGLSPGPLGIALFVGAGASIASMGALGWASDRLGRKVYLVLASSAFGVGIAGLALAGSSYLALLVPLAALVLAFAATRFPRPEAGGAGGERPLGGEASVAATEAEGGAGGRWALYRNGPLLLVAAIACLGLLAEGEMYHWSGIYLRDTLGLAAVVGGSGVAVFYGAQALGRLAIGWLVGARATAGRWWARAPWRRSGWRSRTPRRALRWWWAVSCWWASGSRQSRPWPSRWPGIWCPSGRAPPFRW